MNSYLSDAEGIPPVPKNYRDVTDQSVWDIGKAVQRLIPIIEELGDNMQIEVEDYVVEIKRKNDIIHDTLK